MSDRHAGHAHHPPITGEPGELVDLFIRLLDRETETDPHWWYNYGQLTLLRFTRGFFTDDMDRPTAMGALREVLNEAITDGSITEDFLIRSLKNDLDEYVRGREDPSNYNRRADDMRALMEKVIDDPVERDRWRQSMAKVRPEYADFTDEQMIADAKRTLDASPTTRHVSADEAANRWADAEEWWRLTGELLPDAVFEHWGHLRSRRDRGE